MAHHVQFTIPFRELGKSDVVFEVWEDDEKLGRLEVSKGSLVWYPRDASYGHKMRWSQLDDLMREYPRAERR
jgi:hypothetical protein